MQARRIHITGVVQGVGFRPFIWSLAERLALTGWVRNSSSGVDIVLEGPAAALDAFDRALRDDLPPLARLDRVTGETIAREGFTTFEIVASRTEPGAFQPIAADVATCADCLRELNDPLDRRYRYPFLNCTNCGPRFTIIRDIPYDRPATTLADFPMCADCRAEYENPADRRFHAQPVACPACGPGIWLEEDGHRTAEADEALVRVRRLIAADRILAVKGLGGFHLVCAATSAAAVAELRRRKQRHGKPFALMAPDPATIARYAEVPDQARRLLESAARPVVLLNRRANGPGLAPEIAPGLPRLGFMLPYTPLHELLLAPAPGYPEVLVMTSGNLSDEPIAFRTDEGRQRLGPLADALLLHDRPIHIRCDDSVVAAPGIAAVAEGSAEAPYFFRRSRGYAPLPLTLPLPAGGLVAVGGELKNTFCLTRDDQAFLSHHIGDLEYYENLRSLQEGLAHFERLFRVQPRCLVHDLHPDYQSTRYAQARGRRDGLPTVAVQHHHAHIAACMADNGLGVDRRVIGVALDGTGYGTDGHIWGGEFLVAGYGDFTRAAHLAPCPLPGGDATARNPYRMALSWLHQVGLDWRDDLPPVLAARPDELDLLAQQLDTGVNTPLTTSMGRLFDAAASLAGLTQRNTYEAQAPCELEAIAAGDETGAYAFSLRKSDGSDAGDSAWVIDPTPVLTALVDDRRRGVTADRLAARFHNGVAQLVVQVCGELRDRTGLDQVALSGGVWQNLLLLRTAVARLQAEDFKVLIHRQVPTNDGGLALGQTVIAAVREQPGS